MSIQCLLMCSLVNSKAGGKTLVNSHAATTPFLQEVCTHGQNGESNEEVQGAQDHKWCIIVTVDGHHIHHANGAQDSECEEKTVYKSPPVIRTEH